MLTTNMPHIKEEYAAPAARPGEVVRINYNTQGEEKHANVYRPYGYDPNRKYDIYYMFHGGGGNAESLFVQAGVEQPIKNALDHLIENGEIPPILVVGATYYSKEYNDKTPTGSGKAVLHFQKELVEDLIPAIEGENRVDRTRRGIGGFSMGAVTTWYALQYNLAHFGRFIPCCGDSWAMGMRASETHPKETYQILRDQIIRQGYDKNDFRIMMMNGTKDISEPMVTALMNEIEHHPGDVLDMSEGGNTVYMLQKGGEHTSACAQGYLFYALRHLVYDHAPVTF